MKAFKTISIIALAALVLAGCEKKELEFTPDSPIRIGERITVTATGESKTKTVLQDNQQDIFWSSADSILLVYGENQGKFISKNTAPAATAEFEGVLNSVLGVSEGASATPKTLYGIYPYSSTARVEADGQVTLKLPAVQRATEGTFDPLAFPSIARSESLNLAFYNVASAIAITVGEDDVNQIIVSAKGGPLAGDATFESDQYNHPRWTYCDNSSSTVMLLPAEGDTFTNGKTYCLGVLPGGFTDVTFTLKHLSGDDGVRSVSSFTFERSAIHKVTLTTPKLKIERLWGKYPNTGWPTDYMAANQDRTMATDGEWVYVAKASSSDYGIVAINIADPTKTKAVDMTGVDGGLFKTACVRTIYDSTSGKYILLASSLTTEAGHLLKIYAWKDGVDSAPTTLLSWEVGGYRRFGDFFTVTGTWNNGELWFRNNTQNVDPEACNLCAQFVLKDGALTSQWPNAFRLGYNGSKGMGSLYFYEKGKADCLLVTDTIGMFFDVNNGPGGKEWTNGTDYSVWAKRFGFTPFEFNGKKYIAYQHMYNAARSWLTILNDTQGTSAGYMQTLIDNDIVFQAAVQIEKDENSQEVVSGATYSQNTMANCSVAVMSDHVIIVGHQQNTGLAVFKMSVK